MEPIPEKTVVITGTSSGIGRATATRLARAGYRVFAGVRKSADAVALRADHPGIVPITIDVTDGASIAAARSAVEAETDRLAGLVNNAGTGSSGPMEYVPPEVLRQQLEVNVVGQIAVTQAFLPLIRRAGGRIVNIGSIGGRIAMPFGGVLCGTKSALGVMTDALRLELRPFGILVCLIEPAAIKTPAADKTLGNVEHLVQSLPPEGQTRYAAMLREFTRRAYEREMAGSPPDVVARAVHHALVARRPRAHQLVGEHARLLATLSRVLPDRLLDHLRLRMFGMPTSAH